MIKVGIPDTANRIHIANAKFTGSRIPMFETRKGEAAGPQAFLVEQPANFNLIPHYHRQEQFQVVVQGGGLMGKHPLDTVSVHYASREAGYGPIVAGPDGLQYLTLRLLSEHGANYMPEARDGLRRGVKKVHATAEVVPRVTPGLPTRAAAEIAPDVVTVIAPREDGMAVWSTLVPAGGIASSPGPAGGAGRMHVVIGGSFMLNQQRLPYSAVVYASNDEDALPFVAVDGPAELLTLQFPEGADRDEYGEFLADAQGAIAHAGPGPSA